MNSPPFLSGLESRRYFESWDRKSELGARNGGHRQKPASGEAETEAKTLSATKIVMTCVGGVYMNVVSYPILETVGILLYTPATPNEGGNAKVARMMTDGRPSSEKTHVRQIY